MIDPFAIKQHSKLNPRRLAWTMYSRAVDLLGRAYHKPILNGVSVNDVCYILHERGDPLVDTAVTSGQAAILDLALAGTECLGGAVVELGSYRDVTTARFAAATHRTIFAVDPYIGYGGWEADMEAMLRRTKDFPHVKHVRLASGAAAAELSGERLSLIFIDAVHDFANTSFDFERWGSLLEPQGMVAFHDVDDFPGTNLAVRRILSGRKDFRLWAVCPNLAVLQRCA